MDKSSQNNSTVPTDFKENKEILDNLKKDINSFLDKMIDSIDSNATETIIKTNTFSVKFMKSQKSSKRRLQTEGDPSQEGMAIVNFTTCENILKSHYNISDESELLIKQVEFNSKTDLNKLNDSSASSGVIYEFFNPDTKDKLNSTLCSTISTPIKIPFKLSSRINTNLYVKSNYLKDVIDIYSSKSPGYYSRCMKSKDNDTGVDLSINYRRTILFQNQSIDCSPGCNYTGVDENKNVMCDCKTSGQSEISNNANDGPLISLPPMNYDIMMCYKETFTDV